MRYVLKAFHACARLLDSRTSEPPYPPEISRIESREQGERWLREAGLEPLAYEFGPRDLFTQCVFVAEKKRT
jgi:hypothetical protein